MIDFDKDLKLGKWVLKFPSSLQRSKLGNNYYVIDLTNQVFAGGGGGPTSSWLLDGNAEGVERFFGTNDNFDIPLRTAGNTIGVFTRTGNFGFGADAISTQARVFIKGEFGTTLATKIINGNNFNLFTAANDGEIIAGSKTLASSRFVFNLGTSQTFLIDSGLNTTFQLANDGTTFFTLNNTAFNEATMRSNGILDIRAGGANTLYVRFNESARGVGFNTQNPTARIHAVGNSATSTDSVLKLENSAATNIADYKNNGHIILNGLTVGKGPSQGLSLVCFGVDTLSLNSSGINNVAIGYESLKINTTGSQNLAIGHNTLKANTTGNDNVAIGNQVLEVNTGSQNTGIGAFALLANTTGIQNTSIGNQSMLVNTTGSTNTAIGWYTLRSNISGTRNVAVGWNALERVTNSFNVGVGYRAGANITTGEYNTAIGNDTMATVTTGSFNTFIGRDTGRSVSTGSGNTIIGASVTGLAAGLSQTIILASGNGTIRYYCDSNGNTGMGTLTPTTNSILDLSSTTKAFLPPRMTTAQKTAIGTPTAGMVVFDITLNKLCVYTTAWETVTSV